MKERILWVLLVLLVLALVVLQASLLGSTRTNGQTLPKATACVANVKTCNLKG